MTTPNPISTHAAKAVTRLISECHMMEFCDADAERIVQDAIDAMASDIMETMRIHPNTVFLNVLRGQFLLTREQALHIAGASDYDQLKADQAARVAEATERARMAGWSTAQVPELAAKVSEAVAQ